MNNAHRQMVLNLIDGLGLPLTIEQRKELQRLEYVDEAGLVTPEGFAAVGRHLYAPVPHPVDPAALDWMRGKAIRVTEVSGCTCPNCDCSRMEEEFLFSADKVVDLTLEYRDRVRALVNGSWSEQYDRDLEDFPQAASAQRDDGVLARAERDAEVEVFDAAGLSYTRSTLGAISRFLLQIPQAREMRVVASRKSSFGDTSDEAELMGACADADVCADVIVDIQV